MWLAALTLSQKYNLKPAAELGVSKYKEIKLEYTLARNQPEIIGQICQGFCLTQYQSNYEVSSFANEAYFKFAEVWVRLYFEPFMVFWGEGHAPQEPVNSDIESMLVLVNLNEMSGVVGCVLKSIEYGVKQNNVFVSLSFEGGKCLVISHNTEADTTNIHC
ncbi:MAG: hypothetical protein U1F46_08115 [Marinagarivorans sp.]